MKINDFITNVFLSFCCKTINPEKVFSNFLKPETLLTPLVQIYCRNLIQTLNISLIIQMFTLIFWLFLKSLFSCTLFFEIFDLENRQLGKLQEINNKYSMITFIMVACDSI